MHQNNGLKLIQFYKWKHPFDRLYRADITQDFIWLMHSILQYYHNDIFR